MGKALNIVVNGRETEVSAAATVGTVVDGISPDRARVAVERNERIVPRAAYDETGLEDGDRIEIVTLVGGG